MRVMAAGFRRRLIAAVLDAGARNGAAARAPLCRHAVGHGQRTQHRAVVGYQLLDAQLRPVRSLPGRQTITYNSQLVVETVSHLGNTG
jgi:hypothetical protein